MGVLFASVGNFDLFRILRVQFYPVLHSMKSRVVAPFYLDRTCLCAVGQQRFTLRGLTNKEDRQSCNRIWLGVAGEGSNNLCEMKTLALPIDDLIDCTG